MAIYLNFQYNLGETSNQSYERRQNMKVALIPFVSVRVVNDKFLQNPWLKNSSSARELKNLLFWHSHCFFPCAAGTGRFPNYKPVGEDRICPASLVPADMPVQDQGGLLPHLPQGLTYRGQPGDHKI
jgi:hypothetical protein